MRREQDAQGFTSDLGGYGHPDSPSLLASDLWLRISEFRRGLPSARWVLHEETDWRPLPEAQYAPRWRLHTRYKTFAVYERRAKPK